MKYLFKYKLKKMEMKRVGLLLITSIILLSSCKDGNKNTEMMTVASEKRMAMGVAPMEVLVVKEGNDTDWSFFYSGIEGFDYEPGYEYVLEVKKEAVPEPVPADASSIKYTLVKEVSKTKKDSENMPQSVQVPLVWTGKVLEIQGSDAGKGAAEGQMPVTIAKIQVTALNSAGLPFAEGDTIHAELLATPTVTPIVDAEYVFKSKESHPAHALGVYMLETDLIDLTK